MRRLIALFAFEARLGRWPFMIATAVVFFSQHAVATILLRGARSAPAPIGITSYAGLFSPEFRFWVMPLTLTENLSPQWPAGLAVAMAAMLLVAWLLAALAFARAADAGASGWTGALALVPVVQIPVLIGLCLAPPKAGARDQSPGQDDDAWRIATAARGAVVGVALCISAVALSTLVFGVYGYGLFLASPLVVGTITAFIANRPRDIGAGGTLLLVILSLLIGGMALLGLAIEGVVCIIMAAPLALVMGIIGGLLGRALAVRGREPVESSVFAIALLPALFAIEHWVQAPAQFRTTESVVVQAPPATVWRALVRMGPIPERPSLPFRLGVAYPVNGQIEGQGVGARREGFFSTGVAYELITAWRPGSELDFVVLSDPPMMRELSPYGDLKTPHLIGYYHTGEARFSITPAPRGWSRLSLSTTHTLRLEPTPYWLPLAEWAVRQNKLRVLAHFKHMAEEDAGERDGASP